MLFPTLPPHHLLSHSLFYHLRSLPAGALCHSSLCHPLLPLSGDSLRLDSVQADFYHMAFCYYLIRQLHSGSVLPGLLQPLVIGFSLLLPCLHPCSHSGLSSPPLSQSALFPIRGVCILNVLNVLAASVSVAAVPLLQPPPCPFPVSQTLEQDHQFTVAGHIPDVLGGSKLS